ncbi:MAG: ribonuclease III [Clostridiales bacterium]|jgi:ribonuclease III|nr:ribonuclease III [Clostridiales bacterium]
MFKLNNLKELEQKIGYTFKDKNLINTATIHKSYANDMMVESNERLEFLGDSILEFVMTNHLYKILPHRNEGELTKIRSFIVCEDGLFGVADKLDFKKFLKLGKSQNKAAKPLLADMVEAMIAAIFLDGGMEEASKFALSNLKERIEFASKAKYLEDYKTILQEMIQADGTNEINYETVKEIGPDHDKEFFIEVSVNDTVVGKGKGKSKKEAQTEAAKDALINMKFVKREEIEF